MKVYKFGGASVKSSEGVRNLLSIAAGEDGPLFIVVSAMGKTTNALEGVLERVVAGDMAGALDGFAAVEDYHRGIVEGLWGGGFRLPEAEALFARAREVIGCEVAAIADGSAPGAGDDHVSVDAGLSGNGAPGRIEGRGGDAGDNIATAGAGSLSAGTEAMASYDRIYDGLVSYGELISTVIISCYLRSRGAENLWVDMRRCLVTDGRHRDANVDLPESGRRLRGITGSYGGRLFVGQGFIGATAEGEPTTLGREGSDYTAAVVGSVLGAESVSIWKDVDGILNADPRLFEGAVHIPELTYLDAIELAYSGAQVIHPKTIKPLQNASIPLYVRPFMDPGASGSVIRHSVSGPVDVPVYIVKGRQVLVSVRPKDFSFVLEERLSDIFAVFARYRQKISLIQSSAVNLSVCVDDSRQLDGVVRELRDEFRVVYNRGVELLTIRGYDAAIYDRYAGGDGVLLVQKTRRSVRIVRREGR